MHGANRAIAVALVEGPAAGLVWFSTPSPIVHNWPGGRPSTSPVRRLNQLTPTPIAAMRLALYSLLGPKGAGEQPR